MAWSKALAAACVVTLLSGCLFPTPPGSGSAGSSPLPGSLDVNLQDSLLRIAMPEGQPTMLVALNVTKAMWVRPFVEIYPTSSTAPTRPDSYWVLCPWIQSEGLPDDVVYWLRAFWLTNGALVAASETSDSGGDAEGGRCASRVDTLAGPGLLDIRPVSIATDEPRDGTLAILLTVRERGTVDAPRTTRDEPMRPPAFRLLLGIARDCEGDAGRLCPPAGETAAEPLLRAGPSSYAACASFVHDPAPCDAFDVDDAVGAPWPRAGAWGAAREGRVERGVTVAFARHHGPGDLELLLEKGEARLQASCTMTYLGWAAILTAEEGVPKFTVRFDSGAGFGWAISLFEIPLDLSAAGFSLETTKNGLNEEGMGGCGEKAAASGRSPLDLADAGRGTPAREGAARPTS